MVIRGQELIKQPPLNTTELANWHYDAFSYADFGSGEVHAYFSLLNKLNPELQAELSGFYDSYRASDYFDVTYRVKWYPTKKLYLFSGAGVQLQRSKATIKLPIPPVRMTKV